MKKYIIALCTIALLTGCSTLQSWFDLDGNGRIDPLVYLENSNITVGWEDEDGMVYNVALDELGKQIVGQFIQAKTGYKVELVDGGGFTITDPDGYSIQVAPIAQPEEATL